jgi:hypothetical protein
MHLSVAILDQSFSTVEDSLHSVDDDNRCTTERSAHHGEPARVTSYQARQGFAVVLQRFVNQHGETPVLTIS